MILTISHKTTYRFDPPLKRGMQQLRLVPLSGPLQSVTRWALHVTGGRQECRYADHHGNAVSLVSLDDEAREVTILSEGEVEVTDRAGVFGMVRGPAPLWYYARETPLTKAGPRTNTVVRRIAALDAPDLERLHALSAEILAEVAYEPGVSTTATTVEEAFALGRGVCQDHTHIFLAAARRLGYPARYVSGYLMMNDRIIQEASHAWAEAWLPELGWVGFDISNRISPDARYVRLACGLDYVEAAPIHGLTRGDVNESIDVTVQVQQ